MSNVTLADIKAAADAKFGATVIEITDDTSVTLVNALRLSKEKRKEMSATQSDDDADIVDRMEKLIRIVAKTEAQGDALVEAAGHDAAILIEIVTAYTGGTQTGEASSSES